MSVYIIKTLAIARTLVGVSLLAVPILTSRTFFLPASTSSTLSLRLCGARDAALGGLLWSASSRSLCSSEAQLPALLRPALMTGAVVDALDLVSVGACLVDGSVNVVPAAVVGGGAAVFLAAGVWGLRSAKLGGHGYTQVQ